MNKKLLTDLKREEDENVTAIPTTTGESNAHADEEDIEECFKLIDSQLKHRSLEDVDKGDDQD
jgi:hypothetical protein